MKHAKKVWLGAILATMLSVAAAGILAGCGTAKGKLTLDAGNGGTLSETEYKVKVGADLGEFLEGKAPVAEEGLTFEGWYSGDLPLEAGSTMTAEGITLTAKYTAQYSLLVYKEGETEGDYTAAPEKSSGSALYLEALDVSDTLTIPDGYEIDEDKENVLSTDSLGKNTAFTVYLARKSYTVRFYANLDNAELESDVKAVSARYGMQVEALDGTAFISQDKMRLAGWAEIEGGEIVYKIGEDISVGGNMELHGVWYDKLEDLLGGSDVVYLLDEDPEFAMLTRGGIDFEGKVSEDGKSVTFAFSEGNTYVVYLYPNGFAAHHENYEGEFEFFDTFYSPEGTESEPMSLKLDGRHGATLAIGEGETAENVEGEYTFDTEMGYFFFESEDMEFYFMLGKANGKSVFILYNPEEDIELVEFIVTDPETGRGMLGSMSVSLDGSGGAVLSNGSQSRKGSYYVEDSYSLTSGDIVLYVIAEFSSEEFAFRTTPLTGGLMAYVERNDTVYGKFSGQIGGKEVTLVADGYDTALIQGADESGELASFYVLAELESFGGTVIKLETLKGETYTVLVGEETFSEFDLDFTEYLWLLDNGDGAGLYYPLLLLYEDAVTGDDIPEGAKRAEIYSMNSQRQLVHSANGYYTAKDLGGVTLYSYTQQKLVDGFDGTEPYASFECLVGSVTSGSGALDVYYVLSIGETSACLTLPEYVFTDEQKTVKSTGNYILFNQGADPGITGMGSLYIVNTYDESGEKILSSKALEGSVSLLEYDSFEGKQFLAFTGYSEDGKFTLYFDASYVIGQDPDQQLIIIPLDYAPVELNTIGEDGSISDDIAMALDGAGGGVWNVYGESGSAELVGSVNGTVEITGKTSFGADIYTFTPETNTHGVTEKTFTIEYYEQSFWGIIIPYWILHEKAGEEVTLSGDDGTLVLDGFMYQASFTDADGDEHLGTYTYGETDGEVDKNVIVFWSDDGETSFTMDIDPDETSFTMRDGYEGRWDIWNDALADYTVPFGDDGKSRLVAIFDGYGHVQIERYQDTTILAEGAYEIDKDGLINHLSVEWEGGNVECSFVFVNDGYDLYIVIENVEHKNTLIADTGEVFILDGFGFADYYNAYGIHQSGAQYTVLEDGAWIILLDSSTSLFLRSVEGEGAVNCELVDNSDYISTYYASDLSGVVFLETVVQLDGKGSYYTVSEDGTKATLYTPESDGTFKKSTIDMPKNGVFTYGGKTFYLWTEKELTFTSASVFAPDITIKFTPDGTVKYTVPMFFMSDTWDGMFEMDAYYNYLGVWTAEIYYDDGSDWYYVTLNYDFEKNTGTFEFVAEDDDLTEYTIANDSTLYVLEGDWGERSYIVTLKTSDKTHTVFVDEKNIQTASGDASSLLVLTGEWGEVKGIVIFETAGKTIVVLKPLAELATEESDETYGTIYGATDGTDTYKFCIEKGKYGNTLHLIADAGADGE